MFQLKNEMLVDMNIEGKIATLTLSSPPANVLSSPMIRELKQACIELSSQDIAAIVITGMGVHSFSTGASIKEQGSNSVQENKDYFFELYQVLEMITDMKCPVISAVNGYALGAGFELALCTDIRIMDENAVMGAVAVNLGLVFCTQRLPRLVGYGRAKEMLFTGRHIDAQEALALGIVEYVTPAGLALQQAQEMASIIALKDPHNLQLIKQAVNQGIDLNVNEGIKLESQYLFEMFDTENYQQRVRKFLKKN